MPLLYHSLRIDSVAQVITVALLFGTGLVASLAGRARRRQTAAADTQAGIIGLLDTITRAAAAGENTDQLAAEGIYTLLDARRVVIRRGLPDHEVVVADIGEPEVPLDVDGLTQLDGGGHILDGRDRPPKGSVVRWVRPSQGAVLRLVQQRQPVGRLIVTFREGQWIPPSSDSPWPPSPTPWRRPPARPSVTTSRQSAQAQVGTTKR